MLRRVTALALGTSCLVLASSTLRSAEAPAGSGMPALEAEYRALMKPRVAGVLATPAMIMVGRAELRPGAGSKVFQLQALGRPCGLLVEGPSALVYRIEEASSQALALRNIDGLNDLNAAKSPVSLVLTATLQNAAIWSWELATAHGEAQPTTRALPDWLDDHLTRQFGPNPGRDMLLSSWNKDPGYAWALFKTSGDLFGLDVDPRPQARLETFVRYEQAPIIARPYGGRRYSQELATQPIGRKWWDPVALPFTTVATEIRLVNDKGPHATVETKSRISANDDNLRLLALSLWDAVARDDEIKAHRVTRLAVNGTSASFVHHEDTLLIYLPQLLSRGQAIELEVATEGDILLRPAGDNYWILGYEAWYPKVLEGLQRAAFRVWVSVPDPYVPFASGAVTKREQSGGAHRIETALAGPAEAAVVLAGKYHTISESQKGQTVNVATYVTKREKEAKKLATMFFAFKDCYEYWLGTPYPFTELHVLEVNDWGWGQAPPGVIFITKEAFMTRARAGGEDSEWIAEVTTRGFNERFAHEIAHGYFPHVALIASAEDEWLSESFADYASAVCVQRSSADKAEGARRFERQLKEWKGYSREIKEGVSIHLANHLSRRDDRDELDRRYLLYGRGPLVLHALRQELGRQAGKETGEKQFFALIRAYVMSFQGKTASTPHLIGILNQITGKDWQPWFEKYVYGTEAPRVD